VIQGTAQRTAHSITSSTVMTFGLCVQGAPRNPKPNNPKPNNATHIPCSAHLSTAWLLAGPPTPATAAEVRASPSPVVPAPLLHPLTPPFLDPYKTPATHLSTAWFDAGPPTPAAAAAVRAPPNPVAPGASAPPPRPFPGPLSCGSTGRHAAVQQEQAAQYSQPSKHRATGATMAKQ
jgi:hypothetical protein